MDLEVPILPSESGGGHLREFNDPFLLGQIASLFCSLRSVATGFVRKYNDHSVLKMVSSNPKTFLARIGRDALKYAGIHKADTRAWQYKMICDLFAKLSPEVYSLCNMTADQEACASVGFFKQSEYNLNRYRLNKKARLEKLSRKKKLTEGESEELSKLQKLFEEETD
jgi:hypothetical protein